MAYPLSTQESSLRFAVPRSLAICGRATLTTNRSRLASTTPADTMASTSPGAVAVAPGPAVAVAPGPAVAVAPGPAVAVAPGPAVAVAPGAAVLAALPRRVRSVIELTVTTASSINNQPTRGSRRSGRRCRTTVRRTG